MFVFLQSWRATLIPAIAVPVVLLGTFGILAIAGFTINTLTLFGMVLSIGLLVDDAIVVVENVERVMEEEPDISPREATIKSMGEIQTALIAIALVLSAVFLPMAFFGGSVGVIYRQFSVTIVSSMALSVVVALVLTPALTATLLKRPDKEKQRQNRWVAKAHHYGDRFNDWFARTSDRYRDAVVRVIEKAWIAMLGYAALVAVLILLFLTLPSSFLPVEDQARAQIQYTLPPGATQVRTEAAAKAIQDYFLNSMTDGVDALYTVSGQGGGGGAGQNAGRGFVLLKPWDERTTSALSADTLTKRATRDLGGQLRDVEFFALSPPAVRGLGQSNGFTMQFLNTGGLSRADFKARRDALVQAAQTDPKLSAVRLGALEDNPSLTVAIDDEKIGALGLTSAQVDQTLGTAWGGTYVNDFIDRGRVKRVYVQGDAPISQSPRRSVAMVCARHFGRDGALLRFCKTVVEPGAVVARALQWHAGLSDPGAGWPRRELGRGDGGDRCACRQTAGDFGRLVGPLLSGATDRKPGAVPLWPVAACRLPMPRRTLRKLVGTVRGDDGDAHRSRRVPPSPSGCAGWKTTSISRSAC